MTDIDLDRLEELERKATKGPWVVVDTTYGGFYLRRDPSDGGMLAQITSLSDQEGNAALIAEARNALPELIRLARIGKLSWRSCSRE